MCHHLDDTAERVAGGVRRVDLRRHGGTCVAVETADRIGVQGLDLLRSRNKTRWGLRGADRHHVRDETYVECLVEEGRRDRPQGDPGGGLARTCPLENRPRLVEVVLLHADEVRMPRSGPGEWSVSRQAGEDLGVDGIRCHHLPPLGPLCVADGDGYRRARRAPVPYAAEDGDLVLLELHPRATTIAEPAAGQSRCDVGCGHGHSGRHTLEYGDEGGTVRLSRGQPAKHAAKSVTGHSPAARPRVSGLAVPVRTLASCTLLRSPDRHRAQTRGDLRLPARRSGAVIETKYLAPG